MRGAANRTRAMDHLAEMAETKKAAGNAKTEGAQNENAKYRDCRKGGLADFLQMQKV